MIIIAFVFEIIVFFALIGIAICAVRGFLFFANRYRSDMRELKGYRRDTISKE